MIHSGTGKGHYDSESSRSSRSTADNYNSWINYSRSHCTGVTAGFKASIKCLGVELKALSSAHPILLGITVAIAAMAGAYKIINVCTTSFEELSEKAAELNSEIANSQSEMDSYTSKLDEVDQKIKDIQNLGTLSFTDKQELENLQNQRQELENLYNIEKARHNLATE